MRGAEWNAIANLQSYGDWVTHSILIDEILPATIEDVFLANDTGTVDDGLTSDPTNRGNIGLQGFETAAQVQINYSNETAVVFTNDDNEFTFSPSNLDYGNHLISLRPGRFGNNGTDVVYGETETFEFVFVPSTLREITSLGLQNDDGEYSDDLVTTTGIVIGTVSEPNVYAEVDTNSDGVSDKLLSVNPDGEFHWLSDPLLEGSIDLRFRTLKIDRYADSPIVGPWQALSFTKVIPTVTTGDIENIELLRDDGESDDDRRSSTTQLRGTIASADTLPDFVEIEAVGAQSSNQRVEVSGLGDSFFDARSAANGVYEVRARTIRIDPLLSEEVYGDWQLFSFERTSEDHISNEIVSFGLLADTGTAGDAITANSTLVGNLSQRIGDGIIEVDLNGDFIVDQRVAVFDDFGRFVLEPYVLSEGRHVVSARLLQLNEQASEFVASEWISTEFIYDASQNSSLEIHDVRQISSSELGEFGVSPITYYTSNGKGNQRHKCG